MNTLGSSRLMKNEPACARSLQLSRSAKHGATEPRGWGPAAVMSDRALKNNPTKPQAPPAAKLVGCLDWSWPGGGGAPRH